MVKEKETKKTLKNKMTPIICARCDKKIIHPEIQGLTLICPHCKKSVNGQYEESALSSVRKK